ncbi:MAG: outer membrane lipid asymmetry maintenance protein MlaD [Desulfobacterales bacterium]
MNRGKLELAVGVFVLIGIGCIGYLTIKLGRMELLGDNNYPLMARFESVTGLRTGATVEMAGVQVGRVDKISLNPETKLAEVQLKIDKRVELADDVIASIKTTGLIGDKYINLDPGGSDELLKPGDQITETESAVDLEELISKYVFGGV